MTILTHSADPRSDYLWKNLVNLKCHDISLLSIVIKENDLDENDVDVGDDYSEGGDENKCNKGENDDQDHDHDDHDHDDDEATCDEDLHALFIFAFTWNW